TLTGGIWDVRDHGVLQLPGIVTTLDAALLLEGAWAVEDPTGADALHTLAHIGSPGFVGLLNTNLAPVGGPALENAGIIDATNSTLTLPGEYVQTGANGGLALHDGAKLVAPPSRRVRLNAGRLSVSGPAEIDADVVVGPAFISTAARSLGDVLAIHGSLTLSSTSELDLSVTPTVGIEQIEADGAVTEAGTLMTFPFGDVFPAAGSSYT